MNPAQRFHSLLRLLQAGHPSRRALLLGDRYESAAARAFGAQVVVLARSRCRIKWFRLNTVPVAERLAALRMQALAWRPFDNCAFALALRGDSGMALAWDDERARQNLLDAGCEPLRCRLVPEPMLRQAGSDGARLLRCTEGFEGQVWRGGWLCASRWWPAAPDAQEWRLFLHAGAGTVSDLPQGEFSALQKGIHPAAEQAPWLNKPWAALQGMAGDTGQISGIENRVVGIGALALLVCAGAAGRQAWDVDQGIGQRRQEIAALRESAGVVLASRDQALAKAALARQMATWLAEPLPIEVIVHLHDVLGRSGVQLKEMDLSGSKLRIGLQLSPQASRAAIVRDLQAGNWFKNVAEVRSEGAGGLVVLEMVLDGLRPPPLQSAAVSQMAPSAAPAFAPPSAFSTGSNR